MFYHESTCEIMHKMPGILSSICDKVGDICMRELGGNSPPLIMAGSGSKAGASIYN